MLKHKDWGTINYPLDTKFIIISQSRGEDELIKHLEKKNKKNRKLELRFPIKQIWAK